MKYRKDIDGLRALAVVPVVLYHAGLPVFSGGFIGVDVFFVISGFLITSILSHDIENRKFSVIDFYVRRAKRIVPAMFVVTFFVLLSGWFILTPDEYNVLGQSAFSAATFTINMYFLMTLSYFSSAAEFSPLIHMWSLAIEEQFYIFFPYIILFSFALFQRKGVLLIVATLSVVSLLGAILTLPLAPEWAFYFLPLRAWELGAGALVALVRVWSLKPGWRPELIAGACLAGILVPMVLYTSSTPFPGAAALPPVLGAALLIQLGKDEAIRSAIVFRILSLPVFVWVGLISYSLYLWHWPIIVFSRIYFAQLNLSYDVAFVVVFLSVLFAWLSFVFVETPFRARRAGHFGRPFGVLMSTAVALAALAVFGLILYRTGGLPIRVSDDVLEVAAASHDVNPRRLECHNIWRYDEFCTIGNADPSVRQRDFLLWGDSHADAMMPAFDESAALQQVSGIYAGRNACPPVFHVERVPVISECLELESSVLRILHDREDINVVVLVARWALYIEGERFGGEAGDPVRLRWTGDTAVKPEASTNGAIFEAALNATVQSITETGRDVIIVGPVPEVGFDVPSALSRRIMLGLEPPSLLAREQFDARNAVTYQILNRVVHNNARARLVEVQDLFCNESVCNYADATGIPYYVDDDHISRSAAETLLVERLGALWEAYEPVVTDLPETR